MWIRRWGFRFQATTWNRHVYTQTIYHVLLLLDKRRTHMQQQRRLVVVYLSVPLHTVNDIERSRNLGHLLTGGNVGIMHTYVPTFAPSRGARQALSCHDCIIAFLLLGHRVFTGMPYAS